MDRRLPGDEDRLAPDRHVAPATGDSARLIALALLALVPFAILALVARSLPVAGWELQAITAFALADDAWGQFVRAINTLGNPLPWAAVVLALAVTFALVRGMAAALFVSLSFAADFVAFAVKLFTERARPETLATEHLLGTDSFAFPSGHVVRAVALAAAVAWLLAPPPWRLRLALVGAIGAGLVMGYARVALGVHWPTDVLGGTLLGVGWFALTAALTARLARAGPTAPRPDGTP